MRVVVVFVVLVLVLVTGVKQSQHQLKLDWSLTKIASVNVLVQNLLRQMIMDSFCQTPIPSPDFSLGLEVVFVLPLSQEQEQEKEQEQPHQNIPEGNILEFLNSAKSLTKPNQTHTTPLQTLTLPLVLVQNNFAPTKILNKFFLELTFVFGQKISQPKIF